MCVPAIKSIAHAGKGIGIQRIGSVFLTGLNLHLSLATIGIEGKCRTGLGNHRAFFKQLLADGTVFVTGVAGRRERRLDLVTELLRVSRCGNVRHVGFMTACAGAGLLALFRAGRRSRYSPVAPVMTKLPNYLRLGFATNLTSKFPDTGDCTGGLNLYHALVPAVSQGGNVHVAANLLLARSADGFSCATGLGTGGRLRTGGYRNNLVFMPYAIVDGLIVFDSCPSLGGLRLGVRAVGVVQLCRSNRNLMCSYRGSNLCILISYCLSARRVLLGIFTCPLAGTNICTACRSIDCTSYS